MNQSFLTYSLQTVIEIIFLPQVHVFDEDRLGENNPTDLEISNSVLYAGERSSPDVDITILTGRFNSSTSHEVLLMMQCHNVVPNLKNHEVVDLYNAIQPLCGKGGYEVVRKGGLIGNHFS